MKIGDEVYIHGYIDEIRNDMIIIKNEGGYFGTVPNEINCSEILNDCDTCKHRDKPFDALPCDMCCKAHSGYEPQTEKADRIPFDPLVEMNIKLMVEARCHRRTVHGSEEDE